MQTQLRSVWCAAATFAAIAGCGGDDASEQPDPAQLACDETDEPGTEITASTMRDDTAPEIVIGGEPYTVGLSPDDPTFVRVEVEEDTPAILLVGVPDAVRALHHDQEEADLVSAGADEFCPDEIPEHFDVDFHEPGTYFVEFSPAAVDSVWLLVSSAEGHGHAHEH